MEDKKHALAIAYAIKKRNAKKMASHASSSEMVRPGAGSQGSMDREDIDSMIEAMMAKKKMAAGGMVEESEHSFFDDQDDMLSRDREFQDQEIDSAVANNQIGDPSEEKEEDESVMKKRKLGSIMAEIRSRHNNG